MFLINSIVTVGVVFVIFDEKYSMNMPKTIDETNALFCESNVKSEMDDERRKMIISIEEDKYFNTQN